MNDLVTETNPATDPLVTRYYFYALRDQLPLAHDWLVQADEFRPGFDHRQYRCGFLKIDGTDSGFMQGLDALDLAVERVSLRDDSSLAMPAAEPAAVPASAPATPPPSSPPPRGPRGATRGR